MAIELEQVNTTYDENNDNYGYKTVIVHNTDTDERTTGSSRLDPWTDEGEAEASAIQEAIDKF